MDTRFRIRRMKNGDMYLNHMGWGERLAGIDRFSVQYFALHDADKHAERYVDGNVAWASIIVHEESDDDESHIFLNCCFTHPKRRGDGLFTHLFHHITRIYPDMPVRGVFVNRRLEDFVDRYNESLAGMAA